MKIELTNKCRNNGVTCRFYSEGEDSDAYCDIYLKDWELPEDYDGNNVERPSFCKVISIEVNEVEALNEGVEDATK